MEADGTVDIDSTQIRVVQWDNIPEVCKSPCLEMIAKGLELNKYVDIRKEQLLHRKFAQKTVSSLTTAIEQALADKAERQEPDLLTQPREYFSNYSQDEYELLLENRSWKQLTCC